MTLPCLHRALVAASAILSLSLVAQAPTKKPERASSTKAQEPSPAVAQKPEPEPEKPRLNVEALEFVKNQIGNCNAIWRAKNGNILKSNNQFDYKNDLVIIRKRSLWNSDEPNVFLEYRCSLKGLSPKIRINNLGDWINIIIQSNAKIEQFNSVNNSTEYVTEIELEISNFEWADRIAKALSDAIRDAGGKASKY